MLVSVSVGAGIALSGRMARRRGLDLRTAHATISIAALVMIVLHVLALLGDAWFHPTVADLLIPGVRDYREPFMAIGIVAGWLTVVFGFSYYLRDTIGVARARVVHRLTVLTWALSVAHSLGEGSDRGRRGSSPWSCSRFFRVPCSCCCEPRPRQASPHRGSRPPRAFVVRSAQRGRRRLRAQPAARASRTARCVAQACGE